MDSAPATPPVVAVVVATDPGPWFEESLAAFGAQDYANLSVLVVDAGETDVTPRVASVLPRAFVRRLARPAPFGVAANEVIGVVEGASYYLICHDDVAPDAEAVRLLVDEALRSNAGLACPKLVEWGAPERLLAVGAGADRVGVVHPLVDRGELDQQQHDSPRDVFVAPGGALLVRTDLFEALGGFDPAIADRGEDLDLSWRTQVAGARVVAASAARFRHLEATLAGLRPARGAARPDASARTALPDPGAPAPPDPGAAPRSDPNAPARPDPASASAAADAHRLRTLLVCSSPVTLAWLVPLALFYLAGEALIELLSGRLQQAGELLAAPVRAVRDPGALLHSRRRVQRQRHAHDRALRRRQSGGSARFRAWLAATFERPGGAQQPQDVAPAEPDDPWAAFVRVDERARLAAPAARSGYWRLPVVAAVVIAVVLLVGSRELIDHELPAIGGIPDTSGGVASWWRAWSSTWRSAGLGSVGPSPPALGLLGLAGILFLGAVGTLQHVLVLGPLVVGPVGAYRMARPWGGQRGRIVALIAYAAVPLPYDAIARGNWDALVVYAAAPWALAVLARLSDSLPYASIAHRGLVGRVVGLGLLAALVGAVSPSFLVVLAVAGASLSLGSLLVGQVPVAVRTVGVAVAAGVVGFVLLLPWSAHVAAHSTTLFGLPSSPAAAESFGALLHFDTGPVGSGPLGWGLLVAAALPLVLGRSWRLAWAARFWLVALVDVAWAWAGAHGVVPAPSSQIVLGMAAAALAGAVALGAVAFEQDLPGYRFGWRQVASTVAALGLALVTLPVFAGALNGRWHLPSSGPGAALTSLDGVPGGDYRVLWLGAPETLPLASSPLGGKLAWATSWDGMPSVTDEWSSGTPAAASTFVTDLHFAEQGRTTALGHLLAPLGVRYVVVPDAAGASNAAVTSSRTLLAGLARQVDLQPVDDIQGGYTLYANTAWAPARAALPPGDAAVVASAAGPRVLEQTDLARASDALQGGDAAAKGVVASGSTIYVAATYDSRWTLRVGGRRLHPAPALGGTAMRFVVPAGVAGDAVLSVGTSPADRAGQIVEIVLWLGAAAVVVADRRRRLRPGAEAERVEAEWFAPTAQAGAHRRSTVEVPVAPEVEVWVDG